MLLAYNPADGVYFVQSGNINWELCFRFPDVSHPLNTTLADFFRNDCGMFHYEKPVLYTDWPFYPSYYFITLERFPELEDLASRVDKFMDMEGGGGGGGKNGITQTQSSLSDPIRCSASKL